MLKSQILEDLKKAQKEKQEVAVSSLRMLISEIKNLEIDKKGELDDAEVLKVLNKIAKQHRDSIDQFEQAGRNDLADKERQQLEIIEKYLPEQMSDDDLRSIVKKAIGDTGATSMADMGKVMSAVMAEVGGSATGDRVSAMVKEELK